MTGKIEHVEVITSVQRRRRWSAEEKAAIVQETYAPGMSVSLAAEPSDCLGGLPYQFRCVVGLQLILLFASQADLSIGNHFEWDSGGECGASGGTTFAGFQAAGQEASWVSPSW